MPTMSKPREQGRLVASVNPSSILGLYWAYIGIIENKMETAIVYWGYIGLRPPPTRNAVAGQQKPLHITSCMVVLIFIRVLMTTNHCGCTMQCRYFNFDLFLSPHHHLHCCIAANMSITIFHACPSLQHSLMPPLPDFVGQG